MWSHPSGQKFPKKNTEFSAKDQKSSFSIKTGVDHSLGMIKFHLSGDVTVYGGTFVKLLVQLVRLPLNTARRDKYIWPRVGRVYEKFLTMTSMRLTFIIAGKKIDKANCWASGSWSSRCDADVMEFWFLGNKLESTALLLSFLFYSRSWEDLQRIKFVEAFKLKRLTVAVQMLNKLKMEALK